MERDLRATEERGSPASAWVVPLPFSAHLPVGPQLAAAAILPFPQGPPDGKEERLALLASRARAVRWIRLAERSE